MFPRLLVCVTWLIAADCAYDVDSLLGSMGPHEATILFKTGIPVAMEWPSHNVGMLTV